MSAAPIPLDPALYPDKCRCRRMILPRAIDRWDELPTIASAEYHCQHCRVIWTMGLVDVLDGDRNAGVRS